MFVIEGKTMRVEVETDKPSKSVILTAENIPACVHSAIKMDTRSARTLGHRLIYEADGIDNRELPLDQRGQTPCWDALTLRAEGLMGTDPSPRLRRLFLALIQEIERETGHSHYEETTYEEDEP